MEKETPIMPDREGNPWQDKEQKRTEGYRKKLDESRRFTPPSAEQLKQEVNEQTPAARRKYQHEDHEHFRRFYASLDFDQRTEYGNKSPEEKEVVFLAWLENRKRKTA